MQLISLTINKDGDLLREVIFKDGFNIITNSENDGNQIGKSTALRVLNFCLGSDGKSIWSDPESRTKSQVIEDLVTSGRVVFFLDICINGKKYRIKRYIHKVQQKKRKIQKIISSINDDEFDTNDKFKKALSQILGFSIENPTYSSIKNRFVRLDKRTASNIYRYLNQNTNDRQYILYYSYLFGFSGHNDLASEIIYGEEKKQKVNRISVLLNGRVEQDYKDKLKSIDDEIEILRKKEYSFNFKDSQNKGVARLKTIREKIAELTSEITKLNIRISYSNKTIKTYENKQSDIDLTVIEKIYEEARLLVPGLSKTLKETIGFHEQVVSKKINYLVQQVQNYQQDLDGMSKQLNGFLDDEKNLFTILIGESHFSGFIIIENEIQDKREDRGRVSVILDEVSYEYSEISKLDKKIKILREKNKIHVLQLSQHIEIFNKYFKLFTRAIFLDFSLSFNVGVKSDTNEIEFSIVNQEKVSGDGAPRAAALAFDMALVAFVKETGAHLPEFTIQDYLEASDQDKLATLATLANENNIQVVASVLKDKLASLNSDFIDANTVLKLRKSDKFFKVN